MNHITWSFISIITGIDIRFIFQQNFYNILVPYYKLKEKNKFEFYVTKSDEMFFYKLWTWTYTDLKMKQFIKTVDEKIILIRRTNLPLMPSAMVYRHREFSHLNLRYYQSTIWQNLRNLFEM